VATMVSLFCLTLIAIIITLCFAMSVAVMRYNFGILEYINMLRKFIGFTDLICVFAKSVIFGSVIPVISCVYGLRCEGGAQGVGTATTQAVVTSTITVIVLDFILTYLFSFVL
jgi:phospholipid/cholesterol/gamma-HCH transport system permease protein